VTAGMLTVITGEKPNVLGKVFSLKDGGLNKETAGPLSAGRFEVRTFSNSSEVVNLLMEVGTDQAISASVPSDKFGDSGKVVSKSLLGDNPGAMTRTKADMDFRFGVPGLLTLDYDPQPGDVVMDRDALWNLLKSIIPGVENAGVVHWLSGSSHIWNGDQELQGRRGQRVYVLVENAGDIPRASSVLAGRLWLAGYGRVVISKSGAQLLRHAFDDSMGQPARLDYCGGASCKPPLTQRRGEPFVLADGGFLNTRLALPDLTANETLQVDSLKEKAKSAALPAAKARRATYIIERGGALATRLMSKGIAPTEAHERATQAVSACFGGVLLGDFLITLEGGQEVTVGDILDDRPKYHGLCCLDPIEPDYLGAKIVGKLYLFGASPNLHSFAHGGATYRLQRQPARIYLTAGRRAETANAIRDKLCEEDDLFIRAGVILRLDGRKLSMFRKPADLSYLVSNRFALFRKSHDGKDLPCDLDGETANLLLSALEY
jgi:hypothetical protein